MKKLSVVWSAAVVLLVLFGSGDRPAGAARGYEAGGPPRSCGGYRDLAIGVPREGVGAVNQAGLMHVVYGTRERLSRIANFWAQNSADVDDESELGDYFASTLAAGDFDSDGYQDLAVGVPMEDIAGQTDAGVVHVFYGASDGSGLSAARERMWYQGDSGLVDAAEQYDYFGSALAAGDFNGDYYADLAVGVPGQDVSGVGGAGAVHILFGSSTGLTAVNDFLVSQATPDVQGVPEAGDHVGYALATGYLNGDHYADLVMGVLYEDVAEIDAGAAHVLYGSAAGPTGTGSLLLHQDIAGIDDQSEESDYFGLSVATGDFDGNGYDDVVIGVPGESDTVDHEGAAHILYSTSTGLDLATEVFWTQASFGATAESGDGAGWALATGDFDGDSYDDLAAGIPNKNVFLCDDCGAVAILYGTSSGLTTADRDVLSSYGEYKFLGQVLAAGRLNGDLPADVVIGIPQADPYGLLDAGRVEVWYGSTDRSWTTLEQFDQSSPGFLTTAEADDRFGGSLAIGDFGGRCYSYVPGVFRNY